MKKWIFALLVISCRMSAQFTDWDSTSVWAITATNPTNNPCMYNYQYNVYLKSDTVISGKLYHKLYEHGLRIVTNIGPLYSPCQSMGTFPFSYFLGYARYDAVQKKLYQYQAPSTQLFIDYNLHVGDTIKGYFAQLMNLYVTSIDSVLIHGNYHKRFYFSYSGNSLNTPMYVLEGLGSSFGFLEPFSNFELGSELRCFFIDQMLAYQNPLPSSYPFLYSCAYNVGIPELAGIPQRSTVYPSPVVDMLHVEFSNQGLYFMELVDISGQTMYSVKSVDPAVCIPMTALPAGIYFLKIRSSEGTEVKKVVKQ